jgi:hypothetical protein
MIDMQPRAQELTIVSVGVPLARLDAVRGRETMHETILQQLAATGIETTQQHAPAAMGLLSRAVH